MCTFNTSPMDEPLAELRWHYGEAYIINCTGPGRWTAERRDDRTVLHARSAAELLEKIRDDYRDRPVRRLRQWCLQEHTLTRQARPGQGAARPARPARLGMAGLGRAGQAWEGAESLPSGPPLSCSALPRPGRLGPGRRPGD